jgi:predicted RNA-binding Zn ribbon-like protein
MRRAQTESQPGGREPAPGDLALVQSFVNSRWNLDDQLREQLASPAALAQWFSDHDLPLARASRLGEPDLLRALDVREGLRELLFENNGASADHDAIVRLNRAVGRSALVVQLASADQPVFTPRDRDLDAALAQIASIAAIAQVEGSWHRLKACRGDQCGWAFYDHSRNQSGHWCSMSTCGSRSKAREYRRRQRRV